MRDCNIVHVNDLFDLLLLSRTNLRQILDSRAVKVNESAKDIAIFGKYKVSLLCILATASKLNRIARSFRLALVSIAFRRQLFTGTRYCCVDSLLVGNKNESFVQKSSWRNVQSFFHSNDALSFLFPIISP